MNLLKSRFVKDSGTLLSGNVVAQGVAFAAYLVLSRLFPPEDFGLYNIFYSYIEVLIILSTCKYELAIVRSDSDNEAGQLAQLTLRMNALVSIALLSIALVLALLKVDIIPLPPVLILLIPFMVFFCGTTRVYTFLLNRYRHFRPIATSEVVTSVGGVAMKIGLGLLGGTVRMMHWLGLPLGTILGKVAGNAYLRYQVRHKQLPLPRHIDNPKALANKHRNFPLFVMPKEFVSSFSANLPFVWLSVYFDNALIGLFSLALTFTMRPLGILAGGFEKVFYSSTVERVRNRQTIGRDIRRFVLGLNALVIPAAVVAFFFSEPIFTFLFGPKWVGTGYYVRCILPWFVVLLTTNSLAFVPNVFSTQKADFFFQLAQLALRIAALWMGCHVGSFHLAVMLFCGASAVVQLGQMLWYFYQIGRYENKLTN